MIRHVAMFTWKPEVTAEQVEQIAAGLRKLAAGLPAVKAYSCGPDAGMAQGNFDFALVADFDDEAGYVAYRDDPRHKDLIASLIAPVLDRRTAVQFEY